MRHIAAFAFLAALALAPAASAQRDATIRAQTLPQAQLLAEPLLNGTWSMVQGASGQLTITTRPDGALEGTASATLMSSGRRVVDVKLTQASFFLIGASA